LLSPGVDDDQSGGGNGKQEQNPYGQVGYAEFLSGGSLFFEDSDSRIFARTRRSSS